MCNKYCKKKAVFHLLHSVAGEKTGILPLWWCVQVLKNYANLSILHMLN